MALTWIPLSKKQPKTGQEVVVRWSDGTEDDCIWNGHEEWLPIHAVEWADPNYISWKGWFICMWYAIPVWFFSQFTSIVTKSKFLLRIQYPIHLWIECKFQHAIWKLNKELAKQK